MADASEGSLGNAWPLASGTWRFDGLKHHFELAATSAGHKASPITAGDVASALAVAMTGAGETYPPEFDFDILSGERLRPKTAADLSAWIAPHGSAEANGRGRRGARGLPQADIAIELEALTERAIDGVADMERELPPAGNHEFFSLHAATSVPVLLALDPSKGLFHGWLPTSARWEALELETVTGSLAETRIPRSDWRCEVSIESGLSRIFLSTEEGLGCVLPDLLALRFSANYTGSGPAIGAPMQYGELIWAPVRQTTGALVFVSMNMQGEPCDVLDISSVLPEGISLGRVRAPVADSRVAIWTTDAGQLSLRAKPSGVLEVGFQPWPRHVLPAFKFGSPFLSRDGSLWQLCFDGARDHYVYLLLGVGASEMHDGQPRMSSGFFNFRFSTKNQSDPWVEPEHGDDSGTDEVVVPILECIGTSIVLGLRLESTRGLDTLLSSRERLRAVLVVDDAIRQTAIHTFSAIEPWRMRLFVHQRCLWAYHPALARLTGWKLRS